jgi:hypothetical protein
MALSQSALLELLAALDAADGVERFRLSLQRMYQELIEAEATERIGAGPHERTEARVVQRNGHRPRTLSTTAGGSNAGWAGQLSFGASGTSSPSTLTASLSKPLSYPYKLSVFDDTGYQHLCTAISTRLDFQVYASPPSQGVRTYTAYVARDCPPSGRPSFDIQLFRALEFRGGLPVGSSYNGIDLEKLAETMAGLDPELLAFALLTAPGTHAARQSPSDQTLLFEAERAAGKSISQALASVIASSTGAAAALWLMWLFTHTVPKPAPPSPPVSPQPPPVPTTNPGPSNGRVPDYIDWLAADLMVRDPKHALDEDDARKLARACVAAAQYAISHGALVGGVSSACEDTNIFFPGTEYGTKYQESSTAKSPTVHVFDAIASRPSWMRLSWVNRYDHRFTPLAPGWYSGFADCPTRPSGWDCDEYPFFSSAQAGPGASLRPIPQSANRSLGSKYGWFGTRCGAVSAPVAQGGGTPLVVVPMQEPGLPPTSYVCAQGDVGAVPN